MNSLEVYGFYFGLMIMYVAAMLEIYGIHSTLKKILKKLEEK